MPKPRKAIARYCYHISSPRRTDPRFSSRQPPAPERRAAPGPRRV